MIVDFHVHAIPPEVMGKAGKHGPEELSVDEETGARIVRVGTQTSRLSPRPMDKPYYEMFIEAQERHGVDKTGLQITPLFYFYWIDPDTGAAFARSVNDTLSGYVSHYPDRLFFFATLPMQDIDASVKEAERAVRDLGAKGIVMGTDNVAGHDLDDPALFPLYEKIVDLDVPLFTHPGPYNIEDQGRPDKYNFSWIPGYEFRETMAVCHLIFGGVLDEYPDLKVCVSHGGGTVPFLVGKLERLIDKGGVSVGESTPIKAKRPFREYLRKNFYFDSFVEDGRSLELLLDVMGTDRVLFGQHTGLTSTGADELSKVKAASISDEAKAKVLGQNAVELFRL